MRDLKALLIGPFAAMLGFCITGCQETKPGLTSPYHPGPATGRTVGYGVGVAAGNVAGAGVGLAEGAVSGAKAPFDPTTRLVRHWRTETTSDGRTVLVPEEILVDQYGRPVCTPTPRPAQAAQPLVSPKSE